MGASQPAGGKTSARLPDNNAPSKTRRVLGKSILSQKPTCAASLFSSVVLQIEQQQKDPLIDYDAEHLIYFGIFLVIVAIAIIIGMLSRKLEHALIFSLVLTIILWFFCGIFSIVSLRLKVAHKIVIEFFFSIYENEYKTFNSMLFDNL